MVLPLVGAGLALGGAGLVGSFLNKRKLPQFDIQPFKDIISQGREERERQIGRIRPETQALLDQFRGGIGGAGDTARADTRAAAQEFLGAVDPLTSRLVQEQTNRLKRQTFGAVPEAVTAAREAAAATGGLQRGSVAQQLANVPIQAAQQFQEGASDITTAALNAQFDARSKVFDVENRRVAQQFGIDQNTFNTILNSGNQALINELNGLIDESKTSQQALFGLEQTRQTGQIASELFQQQQKQALFDALSSFGGTLIGAGGGIRSANSRGVEDIQPSNDATAGRFA